MAKELHLRLGFPIEHFISIRITTNYPKNILGHLVYLRENTHPYNSETGDELDSAIFQFIQKLFPSAHLGYKKTLTFEEDLENALNITSGVCDKIVTFHFIPNLEQKKFEEIAYTRPLSSFPIDLRMTFIPNDLESINLIIQNEYLIYYPEEMKGKLKTIKKI